MAGFPQLRVAAWLYGTEDRWRPLALLRLLEHKDGSGRWEIKLNNPAEAPTRAVEFDSEDEARADLARLYAEGEAFGQWRIRQPDGY